MYIVNTVNRTFRRTRDNNIDYVILFFQPFALFPHFQLDLSSS